MRRAPRLRVVEGAASVIVPMTSQGILDFASSLNAIATRLERESQAPSTPLGQSWFGPWHQYLDTTPFDDSPGAARGLFALVNAIQQPLHVINPPTDYRRLSRFNVRMQGLYDDAATRGMQWTEPRPPDTEPGKSTSPLSSLESFSEVAIVVGLLWLLSRR